MHLSQIETERLLSFLVGKELENRKVKGFAAITHFFGYQGRSSFPSLFDCHLANTYGFIAGVLSLYQLTGYCVTARCLAGPVDGWKCAAIPLISMSEVKGKSVYGQHSIVIPSSFVDLRSKAFLKLKNQRKDWVLQDHYCNPGPIQFEGEGSFSTTKTLKAEHEDYTKMLGKIEKLCEKIKSSCRFGFHEDILKGAFFGLDSLTKTLELLKK